MTEVKNHLGQTLLVLQGDEVLNFQGQTLATVEGARLLNSRGQELATVDDDGFETTGKASFRLDGDTLLGPSGSRLGTVVSGRPLQRNLAAAAFVQFFLSD